jgi:hypothetical protein
MKALTNIGKLALLLSACVAVIVELKSSYKTGAFSQWANLLEELYFVALLVLPYVILLISGAKFQRIGTSSFIAAVICGIYVMVLICTLYVHLNSSLAYADERGRLTYTVVVNFGILLVVGSVGLMALGLLLNRWRRGLGGQAA